LGDDDYDHNDHEYYDAGINRASESIRENMKASAVESPDYYELKQHKPCFDEEC
jgi:hypothetical protein